MFPGKRAAVTTLVEPGTLTTSHHGFNRYPQLTLAVLGVSRRNFVTRPVQRFAGLRPDASGLTLCSPATYRGWSDEGSKARVVHIGMPGRSSVTHY